MNVNLKKSFLLLKNKQGFSLVGELLAVAILFIMIGNALLLISHARSQTKLLEEEMTRKVSADNVKKAFKFKNTCTELFDADQIIDTSLPSALKKSNAAMELTSEDFQINSSSWLLINTENTTNHKTYHADLNLVFKSKPNKKQFLGPLFITLDGSNKFVNCFSEYSKEEKCQILNGEYDPKIERCKLSVAACPKGTFMVSAGVQKWVCK